MEGYSSEKIHFGRGKQSRPGRCNTRPDYESLHKIEEEVMYTTPVSNEEQSSGSIMSL